MQYKVTYNPTLKTVYIQKVETDIKPGYSVLGLFTVDEISDPIGTNNSDIFYQAAQDKLAENGIKDMYNIRVLTDVANVTVTKPYKVAPALAVYDQTGDIVGFHNHLGQLVRLNQFADMEVVEGLALVRIGNDVYGLPKLDANNHFVADVGHRRGLLADLLGLAGIDGEVSLPTDVKGMVVHNGVPNGAYFIRKLDNTEALGTNSLAIGQGASTQNGANKSLAVGFNAIAYSAGELALGTAAKGVTKSILTGSRTTTDANSRIVYADGTVSGYMRPSMLGLYDISVTFLAREGYTDNWARFVRRGVMVVSEDGITTTMNNVTTPTPDINSGLAGCNVSLSALSPAQPDIRVKGLGGKSINWAIFAEVNCLNEDILV